MLFSSSEECYIFCIMHERYNTVQIIPKTNRFIINAIYACWMSVLLTYVPQCWDTLPHRQMEDGETRNQSMSAESGGDE